MASARSSKEVAIVGAGIAGLTTAFALERGGHEVHVYEASERVGGQIRTQRRDGFMVEGGPHTLLGRDALVDLVDDLGLTGQRLVASERANKRFVVRDASPIPVPMGPKAFVKSELLSTRAKLRLLGEPFMPTAGARDETLADFVTRRLGREVLEYAVGPMVAGTFAGEARKLSARHAFSSLWDLEQEHGSLTLGMFSRLLDRIKDPWRPRKASPRLITFVDGAETLVDALADRVEEAIELDAEVFRVEERNGRWTVRFRQGGKRRQKTVDEVVLAAPAHRLADIELASDRAPRDLSPLSDIYYAPVSIVALGFRREDVAHPLDGFGMLVPRSEQRSILGTLFMSSLFEGRAPRDQVLLTSFVGGARQPELAGEPTDQLVEATVADLDDLLGIADEPTFVEHVAWEKAIPQYNVGYGRYAEMMDRIEARQPGIHFAGSYRDGIAVPDLVTAAYDRAEKISNKSV
ncbi:MAG: protoporphyrinogen oxidase [Persicimonas sp.]